MSEVLDMLSELGGQTYSVSRMTTAGSYSTSLVTGGGDWVPGTVAAVSLFALVQPVSSKEALLIPEGMRNRGKYMVWSEAVLYPALEAGQRSADVITIEGEPFEVFDVQKWGGDLPHYRSIVLRENG